MTGHAAAKSGLKQETIAIVAVGLMIVAVGLTILGTMLVTTSQLEARMDRAVAEIRTEARADRELFTREILRLTSGQSRVSGIVEGVRTDAVR
jgi:hypothetical protein